MSTLEERLDWHEKQIAERLTNTSPTSEEIELTGHLMEMREHLRQMMASNPKEDWPAMAATIDAAESFDGMNGKPN